MSARTVYKIEVHSFDIGAYEKEQLLKPLEEAAEVFGAFQYDDWDGVVDEVADCITACANVYARMGLDQSEVDAAMERCRKRNEKRGRL